MKLRTLTHQVCQEGSKLERVILVHVAVEKELVRRWLFEMVRASDVFGVEGGSVGVQNSKPTLDGQYEDD